MKFQKICGCGYETVAKTERYTKCPECGANDNWEFVPITFSTIDNIMRKL